MLIIRVGRRKVKVFNLLFVLVVLLLLFYLITKLLLLLPLFNRKYNYEIKGKDYNIKSNLVLKKRLLGCNVSERIAINSKDKDLYDFIKKDYMKDGYVFKNKKLSFNYKTKKKCDIILNNYNNVFKNNDFKLLGKEEEIVLLNGNFDDPYASNRSNSKIKVSTNLNTKEIGTYYKVYYREIDKIKNKLFRAISVVDNEKSTTELDNEEDKIEPKIEIKNGLTYVDEILIVNKKYSVPKDYNPGVNKEAEKALKNMQQDAKNVGFELPLLSGFRSYQRQTDLYNSYVKKHGEEKANTFSAKPGYSEHQTGLAFDIGQLEYSFGNTPSGKWLAENAHKYGFIIRYLKGKENITGYVYEPWHVRYLGIDIATKVKESGLSLEEYLGIN